MTLLPNEKQLVTPCDQILILTTQRMQKVVKDWASSHSVTIFLEDISSVEAKFENNPAWLILGILGCLASVYFYANTDQPNHDAAIVALIVGIVGLIAWFAFRQHAIKISSKGGSSLTLNVTNLKKGVADELVDQIVYTKANRMVELHKLA